MASDVSSRLLARILGHEGRHFVIGGPGSGKTTAALQLADQYLSQRNDTARVLFLTFSRTAVSQIQDREPSVRTRWGDLIEVYTSHSLAFRILHNFGRFAGFREVSVLSESRRNLSINTDGGLPYDEIIPSALQVLERIPSLRAIVRDRWPLLIVDESQDCGTQQWDLINALEISRVVFLADPNQMIYRFVPGVSERQFRKALDAASSRLEMPPVSHRDPSGVIPAIAEAARRRAFEDESFPIALEQGRLRVLTDVHGGTEEWLCHEIPTIRARRRSVGIFVQTNAAVMSLSELLDSNGIAHTIVGLPESHAEGLRAIEAMFRYAHDLSSEVEVRSALAVFLASCFRGRVPDVSLALVSGTKLEYGLEERLKKTLHEVRTAADDSLESLLDLLAQSWDNLKVGGSGPARAWMRAAHHFGRLLRNSRGPSGTTDFVRLALAVQGASNTTLVDSVWEPASAVLLMNFHQTKGREMDETILVFEGFRSRESEPFEDGSLLLNVAISRARERVTVLLPADPHPLVEPFTAMVR